VDPLEVRAANVLAEHAQTGTTPAIAAIEARWTRFSRADRPQLLAVLAEQLLVAVTTCLPAAIARRT